MNLDLYEKVRKVPEEAKKKIGGGRLSGMTDINPMWRIKTLTEQFGTCGQGWYSEIVDKHMDKGANDEIAAYVDINLYVKFGDEWSKPIPGTGGSMFVSKEKGGLYTDDECYKKAMTDALSVACKSLGIGADVYWEKDSSKYTEREDVPEVPNVPLKKAEPTQADIIGLQLQVLGVAQAKGLSTDRAKAVLLKNTGKPFEELTPDELASSITKFKNMQRTAKE